ncbi:hypothetical protein RvY_14874 [Ramazzottius varieornatus]|uniref:HAT C-terminal dimerisation domain-containing protein n=1 Tax=Ramazzottius varieornatus TaxID=947166 RepID=A0A1D1VSR8_RAMVA|nr:hypothetical protein RvY_14874 [Ramazzottius varieornatus]
MFEERYTSLFKKPLDFWSYVRTEHTELSDLATLLLKVSPHAAGVERLWSRMKGVHTDARNLLKVDLVTGICVVKMQLQEERKKKAIQENEKAKPKDDVLDVIQTAGPVAEPTPSVDSHVPALAVEFDEFMAELLEKDAEVDADDAGEAPSRCGTSLISFEKAEHPAELDNTR